MATHQRFVLTTHRDPDGDGLSAHAALAEALEQLGKSVRVINHSPLPRHYRFLHGSDALETYRESVHGRPIGDADVVILLDAARPERTGRLAPALASYAGTTMVIDHHQTSGWARVELIEPSACSTTEILHELLDRLGVRLTPTMAEALYTGLVADTMSFRTAHVTPSAHRRAARLLEAGARVGPVQEALFASRRLARLKLLGDFLARLHTGAGGRLIWGVVERQELLRRHLTVADIEGFVAEALTVRGVELAVLLIEEPEDIRLSFRSRHCVRVDGLAHRLGGGGHARASGARIPGPLSLALRRALHEAKQTLHDVSETGGH